VLELQNQQKSSMKSTVPVSAMTLELEDKPQSDTRAPSARIWIEALSIVLLLASALVGNDFWSDWFSSVDRVVCSVCVLIGLFVAFVRSDWAGECSLRRLILGLLLFFAAATVIFLSYYLGRPKMSGIACGLILAGWCTLRILGETVHHSLSLGLVFAIPAAIDAIAARGAFGWLETQAITLTSGVADAAEQSHVREGNRLIFGLGVADQFTCLGKWDGVVSFFGIAIFCVLAFRRSLVSGALTMVMSVVVWIAVRGVAWVALAWLGNRNGVWYDWSTGLEIGLFLIALVLVASIDQFFSALLEPIPFEFINADFPLLAYLWNWTCGLPKLTLSIPLREDDFTALRELEEWEV
jgi:hypothetical protein